MSTISDWTTGYPSPDTNPAPLTGTSIPFPVSGSGTDLGAVIRDRKAVIRAESLNKGWYPDSVAATYVSTSRFTLAGDVHDEWPPGVAVKATLSGSTVYSWVADSVFIAGSTRIDIADTGLDATLSVVTRGAILPGSTPVLDRGWDYPMGVGSPLPPRITQRGKFRISSGTLTVTVPLMRTERDTDYTPLLQVVDLGTASAYALDSFRVSSVTKGTSSFTVIIAGSHAEATPMTWEFCLVRGT